MAPYDPCIKTAYTNRKAAMDALRALNTGRTRAKRGPKPERHVYLCKYCGLYHLSSQTGPTLTLKKRPAPPPIQIDEDDG